MSTTSPIDEAVVRALEELYAAGGLKPGHIVVIGCSTSEVTGKRIGSAGSLETAELIYEGIQRARASLGFYPAFQCCEHLNRALVVEEELLDRYPMLEPVSVIPVPRAGGSMAAYAYHKLNRPVVVESIRAHAGIDIGGTLIGMHLRPVAVPVRPSNPQIGHTYIQMAYSRPKLIGGARAVYTLEDQDSSET